INSSAAARCAASITSCVRGGSRSGEGVIVISTKKDAGARRPHALAIMKKKAPVVLQTRTTNRMDLADLHIFKTVAEEGGIARAAHKLHRVPSNISTRGKQLAETVGAQLF